MDTAGFGLLAGIIGFLAFIPYILDIVKGSTRPNKATWIIWAAVGFVIAASYFAAGARDSAWTPVAYAVGILAVAALSLRYGEKGWTKLDIACLIGAGIGLSLWILTKEPVFALYITTVVDLIGAIPTFKKAHEKPESESKVAWVMFFIANTLNLFAIGSEWTLPLLSYPGWVFVQSALMNILILRPGKR